MKYPGKYVVLPFIDESVASGKLLAQRFLIEFYHEYELKYHDKPALSMDEQIVLYRTWLIHKAINEED